MRALVLITLFSITQVFSSLETAKEELHVQGFTIVENLFTEEEIDQMSSRFELIKEKALEIVANTPPLERLFAEVNQAQKSWYWKTDRELILQAGHGRYDFAQGFSKDLFASTASLKNEMLNSLMTEMMGGEFTSYSGIIHSTKGSADQYWHRDTNTLDNFGSDGSKLVALDDFYFTILIPITVPFTLENGTTEFVVGSHKLSSTDAENCPKAQLEVPIGSALVFNGKIIHRGKANNSLEDRPGLYIVYHKKWYNDQYRKGVSDLERAQ